MIRLHKLSEVSPRRGAKVFKWRSGGDLVAFLCFVVLLGLAIANQSMDKPWFPLPAPVFWFSSLGLAFMAYIAYLQVRASLSHQNWVMYLEDSSLFVRLRSPLNGSLPGAPELALELPFSEVARVAPVLKKEWSTSHNRKTLKTSRLMEFRLSRKLPIEVQEALLAEKALKPPANSMSFLHYPVTMVDEETLRLDLHNCAAPQELLRCLPPNIEQHAEVLEETNRAPTR